ncbi:MAG: hypothetical protein ACRCWQ_02125 [Bacilli bacterium]
MKTRNGFVSNSSSSSFIVHFPRKPESRQELAEMMGECCTTTDYGNAGLTSDVVVAHVWQEMTREVENDTTDGLSPDTRKLAMLSGKDKWDIAWELNNVLSTFDIEETDENAGNLAAFLIDMLEEQQPEEHKSGFTFTTTYADDCGYFESNMEHGNIFRNLPHRRINNH